MELKNKILKIADKNEFTDNDIELFYKFRNDLTSGKIRAAEKSGEEWRVNSWVKKGILLGFKMGKVIKMGPYLDKDTYPPQSLDIQKNIRMVPGGSAVREGAYIGKDVIMMPPMYINVGAYLDDGSMVDSHALIGTCAQIGKNVHISAASQIGGVLEPIGARPVIIEDNVFIGGNCGIYEGVLIKTGAILAAGVTLTSGTPVYDTVNQKFLEKDSEQAIVIPKNAVVVPGSKSLKSNPDFSIYCPIIVKYRDDKSDRSVVLESLLR